MEIPMKTANKYLADFFDEFLNQVLKELLEQFLQIFPEEFVKSFFLQGSKDKIVKKFHGEILEKFSIWLPRWSAGGTSNKHLEGIFRESAGWISRENTK